MTDIVDIFRRAYQKRVDEAILLRGQRMLEQALKAECLTNLEKNALAGIAGVYTRYHFKSFGEVTDKDLLGLVYAIYAVGYGQGFGAGKLEALTLIGKER